MILYTKCGFFRNKSEVTLAVSCQYLSFNLDVKYSTDEDEDQREEDISDHDDGLEEDSATVEEQNKKKKSLVAPHKKRKIVRSQQEPLSQLEASVDQLASVQMKKHKLPLESDIKREEMFLKFKQDEVKKNREHKLEMAKIYANAMMHQV